MQNFDESNQSEIIPETLNEGGDKIHAEENQPQEIKVQIPNQKPIVTYVLIGLSILVYLLQRISLWRFEIDLPLFLGAKFGPLIDAGQWWRLITPIFLHGSIMHLSFNLYALYSIGPELERYFGRLDFLLYYLITGFSGNVLSYVASPDTVSVGASTALFGLIAAQGFVVYKNKSLIRNYQNIIKNVVFILIVNLMLGMNSNIDNWGHLGGLIGGVLLSSLSCPVMKITFDKTKNVFVLRDSVTKKTRYISYALSVAFFIAIVMAFRANHLSI